MKIVFVCTGNTCRSPMAEAIFKYVLREKGIEGVAVSSCGIAVNPNENATEPKAITAVRNLKIPMRVKKSRGLTEKIITAADYIIVMTARQKAVLAYPNVYTLGELTNSGDVQDPYGGTQETYDATAFKMKLCLETLADKICGR